jgi:WD40 repeat protein
LVFLPDGNVIMGDLEGSLRLWNRITREVTLKARLPGSRISPLFVLPKTRTLLTARRLRPRNEIALWDLDTWTVKSWSTNNGWNLSRAVSPDEKWMAEGHDDGTVSLLRLPTQRLERSWIAHQRHVGGLAFTPDSKGLVSCSEDGTAKFWNLDTRGQVAVIYDEINAVFGLAVSHDGRLLALGYSHEEAIKLYDLHTQLPLIDLEGNGSLFNNLMFSSDDSMIMGKSGNGDVLHVWTAPSWAQIP